MRISGSTFYRLALGTVLTAGCGADAFSPPEGAVPFNPPFAFATMWAEVESCAQLSADIGRVEWFVIPNATSFPCSYGSCLGLWVAPHDIYLSEAAAYNLFQEDFFTVRHEMLHDLVGRPGHPTVFQQCGLMRPDSLG